MADPDGDGWQYARKISVYDAKSIYLFHHDTCFRRLIVGIVEDRLFDITILLLIAVNSISLVMIDYTDANNDTQWNKNLEQVGKICTWCFLAECVLKIIA
jgi:hypothetical protein